MGNAHPKSQMEVFQPDRFMGKWYLIAHYPNHSEELCPSSTVQYVPIVGSLDKFSVIVTCYRHGPPLSQGDEMQEWNLHPYMIKTGVATIPKPSSKEFTIKYENRPGKVTCNVLWTDYANLAFLGSDHDYYMILSRKPTISMDDFQFMRRKTQEFGFKTGMTELTTNGASLFTKDGGF